MNVAKACKWGALKLNFISACAPSLRPVPYSPLCTPRSTEQTGKCLVSMELELPSGNAEEGEEKFKTFNFSKIFFRYFKESC